MTIPDDSGAMPGWIERFPEEPRLRLLGIFRELHEEFPFPGTRFLIQDAAIGRLRMEDLAASSERYRGLWSRRAGFQWESMRTLEIEALASKLMSRPSATVRALETSPAGVRWLLEKWGWMLQALERGIDWNESSQTYAQRLLGIGAVHDSADPRNVRGGTVEDRKAIARNEIDRLNALLTPELQNADEADRQAAIDGTSLPNDAAYRSVLRQERDARRHHDRAMADLNRIRDRFQAEQAEAAAAESGEITAAGDEPTDETGREAPRPRGRKAGRQSRSRSRSRRPVGGQARVPARPRPLPCPRQ